MALRLIALITLILTLDGCAATGPPLLIDDVDPYHIDLAEGRFWEYWRLEQWPEGRVASALDTLVCTVVELLPPPDDPVLLDGQLGRSVEEFDLSRATAYATRPPRYLPVVLSDTLGRVDHLAVNTVGPVARIASTKATSDGKLPYYAANSSAGLLDMTSWVVRRGEMPLPTYVRGDRHGDLVVPSAPGNIGGWLTVTGGWMVTDTDTLITVPAGRFQCIEITYYTEYGSHFGGGQSHYREYWARDTGLVGWIDQRAGGDGIWVLVSRGVPPRQGG